MSNAYKIGLRLKEEIEALVQNMALEAGADEVIAREYTLPYVSLRKRKSGAGREESDMRINEGITIVPLKPVSAVGTNERDGVGYRFMISIASGTYTDELQDAEANDWDTAEYEEAIRRRFHNNRICNLGLTNACELRTSVEPGEIPQWMKLEKGIDSTFLVLTEFIREARISPVESP